MAVLTSRQNKLVQRWRDLSLEGKARRRERAALLEGPHLVSAALHAGVPIKALILSESGEGKAEHASIVRHHAKAPVIVSDAVFKVICSTESPLGIAAEIELPKTKPELAASAGCVFLESVQDPGNVGGILRSAAAFGIADAVLGQGCADPWSPKALRAAMGAHFSMRIGADADLEKVVGSFGGTLVCTAPREGTPLARADLPARIGWIFGTEGKGVTRSLAARAALRVTIPMAGLAESLNVGAAAAICFYEASRRSGR